MANVILPTAAGSTEIYEIGEPRNFATTNNSALPRVAYAAAHVVVDPLVQQDPWLDARLDWDATLEYRRYLWSLGLGVAEAMDTAQRGMGLDWQTSLELIRRSVEQLQFGEHPGEAFVEHGIVVAAGFVAERAGEP